jgi:uncharacterized membrane protein
MVTPKIFSQRLEKYLETFDEETTKKIMQWHKHGREMKSKATKS